eukprot:g61999.t1
MQQPGQYDDHEKMKIHTTITEAGTTNTKRSDGLSVLHVTGEAMLCLLWIITGHIWRYCRRIRICSLARAWLLFLSLIELPAIARSLYNSTQASPACFVDFAHFFSTLHPAGPEYRLWALVLALLVLSRLSAAHAPHSPAVQLHNAAVHTLEALAFLLEWLCFSSQGQPLIAFVLVANAALFCAAARHAHLTAGSSLYPAWAAHHINVQGNQEVRRLCPMFRAG